MTKKIEPVLAQNIINLATAYMAVFEGKQNKRGRPRVRRFSKAESDLRYVSRRAFGESQFLSRVIKGEQSFFVRKYDEVVQWFTDNWPEGQKMPRLIDPKHNQKVKANGKKTTSIRDRGESRKGKQGGSKKVSAKGGEEGGSKEA